jgi:hypothetical protein
MCARAGQPLRGAERCDVRAQFVVPEALQMTVEGRQVQEFADVANDVMYGLIRVE